MNTLIAFTFALAAIAWTAPSQAAAMAPVKPGAAGSQLVQVRDGCGFGRHYSMKYRRCVPNWWR